MCPRKEKYVYLHPSSNDQERFLVELFDLNPKSQLEIRASLEAWRFRANVIEVPSDEMEYRPWYISVPMAAATPPNLSRNNSTDAVSLMFEKYSREPPQRNWRKHLAKAKENIDMLIMHDLIEDVASLHELAFAFETAMNGDSSLVPLFWEGVKKELGTLRNRLQDERLDDRWESKTDRFMEGISDAYIANHDDAGNVIEEIEHRRFLKEFHGQFLLGLVRKQIPQSEQDLVFECVGEIMQLLFGWEGLPKQHGNRKVRKFNAATDDLEHYVKTEVRRFIERKSKDAMRNPEPLERLELSRDESDDSGEILALQTARFTNHGEKNPKARTYKVSKTGLVTSRAERIHLLKERINTHTDEWREFLRSSKPEHRPVYELIAVGSSVEEAAASHGLKANTVYRRLQRARLKLYPEEPDLNESLPLHIAWRDFFAGWTGSTAVNSWGEALT